MKNAILLALASLLLYTSRAQENISGIINAYAAVQSIDYCNNTIQVSTTDGFVEGDALLLIQMQGAEIDVSNSSSFGSITNLGSAGLYERAVIETINGLEITLDKSLVNTYDTNGAVQIVSMPSYPSGAAVTDTLTARAWDGGTGGVLVLEASNIVLQAPIDVSGKGFRGGSGALNYNGDCNFLSNYSDFSYPETSIRGARKGEGISAIAANRARGRGSQANGGGGGNDHNAGGGGGGNINAGGTGGENISPSFFGCDGQNPGQGGKAIAGISAGRLFMGGGGGAGHGNNNGASGGGAGGGIVILRTGGITANGFAIRANGLSAATSGGDGAGGGGGGGAIALILSGGNGAGLLLEAEGGNGGDANNQTFDQCFGPGGGGGGGRILRAGAAMATTSLAGGQPGVTFNSGAGACGTGPNGALAGPGGSTQSFEDIPEGTQEPMPFAILAQAGDTSSCPGVSLTLPVSVQGGGISYQWQVDEGSGFTNLQSGFEYGATDVLNLLINTVTNAMDGNVYRLQITGDCIGTVYTDPLTLTVIPGPLASFSFTIDGLQATFDNTSSNADTYSWDFGDGNSSNAFEPAHTFPGSGAYDVTLFASNDACSDTASFSTTVNITQQQAPQAAFQPMPAAGCAPVSVLFSNTSTGGTDNTYQWLFPGGDPATSTDGAPIVNYNSAGAYDVTLIATNSAGSDTLTISEAIQVGVAPTADFGLSANDLTITLDNLSSGADSYLWDFGDGNTSTAFNPTHTYGSAGDYEISLTVTNACGTDVLVLPVTVAIQPVPLFSIDGSAEGCQPHTVYLANESTGDYDSLRWDFPGGMPSTSTIPNPEVVYDTPGQYSVQLTLFWPGGEETATQTQAITVQEGPQPEFTFTATGLSATFNNLSANADSYTWDFGDGNSSTAFEPTHAFPASGVYDVTLFATSNTCSDTASFTAQVSLQLAPQAAFQPTPSSGCAPLSVTFTNTSAGGAGTTYQWFFTGGNPATSTDGAPMVSYNNAGTYDVTLIATNSAGSDTLSVSNAIQVGAAPTADFGISTSNLTLILNNLSSGADSYLWDFGDGNSSTLPNPTHTYDSAGDYEVSLTVTNSCGSDVMVIPVTVVQRPVPVFSNEGPINGCLPHTVYFVNASTGDYDSLRWEFPGGMPSSSTIPAPEVVYNTPGEYAVQLTLFWAGGEETLNRPQAVTVLERPQPAFTFELNGLTATFTNLSTNATEYTWNFGDGATSNEANPVHTFPGPGNYDVTLNASNQGECTRANGQNVFIQPNGVEEHSLPANVKLFPNPTAGQLRLQSERQSWYPVQWRLLNAQGQVMDSGIAAQDRDWSLAQYPTGPYLLQFVNADGWWTVRVLKY